MGSRLNPDGAKIKALRIQRGWTQEQLAEIAGVSTRTVQRAETANCAAFETVRAMASAFETDFGQLLKRCPDSSPDPMPQIVYAADVPGSAPEIELIPADPPKPPAGRTWLPFLLSASTLVLGLVAGIFLTPHLDVARKSNSPAPPGIPSISEKKETPQEPVPATVASENKPARKASSKLVKPAVPILTADVVEIRSGPSPSERPADIPITADHGSQDLIPRSQPSASLDLPPQSQSLLSELLVPKAPVASPEAPAPDKPTLDDPDPGAVRQAVDLAAKKTGTFASKVGASLKRVF